MSKYLAIVLFLGVTFSQDVPLDFTSVMTGVVQQWGEVDAGTWAELFSNFTQGGGLNGIWHGLDEHCSSNIQCGPGACCMKPTILGLKRAITDGSNVHFGSYCAKLRKAGDTCSKHDNNQHYYNFHCPCETGLTCVPGGVVQLHPLITVETKAVCK